MFGNRGQTFYGIDYFLFAPALTLFCAAPEGDCAIIANVGIVYANGAVVSTGFHTSLFPGARIYLASSLHDILTPIISAASPPKLPKYDYPANVVTAARMHTAVGGGDIIVRENECCYVRSLDAQKSSGKGLFGNGYFISTAKAKAIEKAKAKAKVEDDRTIIYELSAREKRIIERLDAESDKEDNSAENS